MRVDLDGILDLFCEHPQLLQRVVRVCGSVTGVRARVGEAMGVSVVAGCNRSANVYAGGHGEGGPSRGRVRERRGTGRRGNGATSHDDGVERELHRDETWTWPPPRTPETTSSQSPPSPSRFSLTLDSVPCSICPIPPPRAR